MFPKFLKHFHWLTCNSGQNINHSSVFHNHPVLCPLGGSTAHIIEPITKK